MNNYLISIIVPVYNAEKYLDRCLNSITSQTYRNLEIILINDGSTDGSGEICKEWQKRDGRIRYISQENKGQGYTRSRGVELSRGDFVAFVDDDDYMLSTMYGTMLQCMLDNRADICACQWNYEMPDGTHTITERNVDDSFYGCHSSVEFSRYLYKFNNMGGGTATPTEWSFRLGTSCLEKRS